jgi:Zn-dependent protease with chaperone function
MQTGSVVYPAGPQQFDERIIQPTSVFKQEVIKVLGSIIFFVMVYFALMAAAILLAMLCGYGGVMLVIFLPKFFTLMIGIGLIGLGLMVIFFLLKFLFKSNKIDRSHLILVTEKEQPALYAFIRTLTKETQAPFPKRIYLSADVNACVFYDSSFWSMFFPIRKNLQIGLGLVNSVNVSEFKAILAHEFGHFSQRSMKLGSYVYNVNKVIYNMLYDNDGYGRTLESWANVSGYFAFFATLTIRIVQGIQWVLQNVYSIINKNYMSLSRQMEFHADAVAASVSGSSPLITSLRRLEVADLCYNRLFDYYNSVYKQNLKPDNLYPQHALIMKHFAEDHDLPLQNGLPQVASSSFANMNRTRVVVKDQWASHPSTDDREEHLRKLDVHAELNYASAWVVFQNAEALQQQVTEKIYSEVTFSSQPQRLDIDSFTTKYFEKVQKYTIDKRYKGFFDARSITDYPNSEITIYAAGNSTDQKSLSEILDEPTVALPYVIGGLKSDLHTLEMIQNKSLPVKTFEFDGEKYESEDSVVIIEKLQKELKIEEDKLKDADKRILSFFYRQAEKYNQPEKMLEMYQAIQTRAKESDAITKEYIDTVGILRPMYYGNLELEQAHAIIRQVKLKEKTIKPQIKSLLSDEALASYFTPEEKKILEEYLSKEHQYFTGSSFLNEELKSLNNSLSLYQSIPAEHCLALKKELLEWQLQIA